MTINMPRPEGPPRTAILPSEMTGDMLASPSSKRVAAKTQHGPVVGGTVTNGCQVFLNVPYACDTERWTDPVPLPTDYRFPQREYTRDGLYCAQPSRPYTLQIPVRDRLGLGEPTENPFFADIYVPSTVQFPSEGSNGGDAVEPGRGKRPVRVFVHGGFLQFGSTSGQHYNQQFFAAEHFGEVRVLLGHRVSALGFLASADPAVPGNYGFKDVWAGLQWVQANIAAFGGDPSKVHLSGLSGGAHVVHQLLHRAARLAPAPAPFVSALLQSNAILTAPLKAEERADQFAEFCAQLNVDPKSPSVLDEVKDRKKYPTDRIIEAVEAMGNLSTFRGVVGDEEGWVHSDQVEYQASGALGRDLLAAGVKVVIMGDVRDEDAFYSIVHDSPTPADLLPNVARYYPTDLAERMLASYQPLPEDASKEQCQERLGRILADGQVHLPARLLARDLADVGMPVVRYAIETVASGLGYNGKASHGSDLAIQHLRLSVLTPEETVAALGWHDAVEDAVRPALEGGEFEQREEEEMLVLNKAGVTAWGRDWRWPLLRAVERAVRG